MFAYCGNSPGLFADPTGNSRVDFQQKILEGGGGAAGGGSVIIGLPYLMETVKDALVSIGALIALVQTSLNFSRNNGEYCVYVLVDKDEYIQYVGRTKNPDAREKAHSLNPNRADLSFHIVGENLNYLQVRGLEQVLMLYCHTIDKNNKQNNQINGISPNNGQIDQYLEAAEKAMGYCWNQFSNEVLCWLGQ